MSETKRFNPELNPPPTAEVKEQEPRIFDDVEFTPRKFSGSKKGVQYQSSAQDRKIIILTEESPKPKQGEQYRVRVIKDTKPEKTTEGVFWAEIIGNSGLEKQRMRQLGFARGAEEALAKNDLNGVLEKLKELQRSIGISEGGIERPEQRERLEQLEREFEKQTMILLNKGVPRLSGMEEGVFYVRVLEPLKKKLKELATREFPAGYIPFIIVPSDRLLSLEKKISLIELDGVKGTSLVRCETPASVRLPESLAYLVVDIEDGKSMLGKSPYKAVAQFAQEGRFPLTATEGVAMVIQHPDILRDHVINLPGSDAISSLGERGVASFFKDEPKLGRHLFAAPHALAGSASCAERIGS